MIKQFENCKTYRHISTLDIDLYVCSVTETNLYSDMFVIYYNRHLKGVLHGTGQVSVKKEDFDKWELLE